MSYPDSDPIRTREWFALEDANNDHIITKEDIEKIGARMGMSQDEIHDSMQYYALGDNNEDGKITWEGKFHSLSHKNRPIFIFDIIL